ncbi:MAG: CvpA family protein [Bacteroidales bacterium]
MTIYIVDIILAGILILGAIQGFRQGFIAQLVSLAALLLGIWGAIHFSDYTATLLTERFNLDNAYLPLISFAITFAVIVIAVHFLGKLLESLFDLTVLGIINKISGLIFGLAKYAFILSVIIVLTERVNASINLYSKNATNKSIVYGPLSKLAPAVFPYLHFESIKNSFKEKVNSNPR